MIKNYFLINGVGTLAVRQYRVGQKYPRYVKKPDKRRGKTVILTSSTYKLELEFEEQEKN